MSIRKFALLFVGVFAALSPFLSSPAVAHTEGAVLPATARPFGWSLARMAGAVALFTTSGNSAAYYPHTPFQILYVDPSTAGSTFNTQDSSLEVFGSLNITVRPGTLFYVPILNADDTSPVLPTWPVGHKEAVHYFFDPALYGARGVQISVDGRNARLGIEYLAGPVTTAPLLDGGTNPGGTHILTMAAFLRPLTPGRHTVSVSGGFHGAELLPTYGISSLTESFTYTVTVGRAA